MAELIMTEDDKALQAAMKEEFIAMLADETFVITSITFADATDTAPIDVTMKGYSKR